MADAVSIGVYYLSPLAPFDSFGLIFFAPASAVGAVWAIVEAIRWMALTADRARLAAGYRLRLVTWLIVTPMWIGLLLLPLGLMVPGDPPPEDPVEWTSRVPYMLPLLLPLAGCVAAVVCAHRVVQRGSTAAAWVLGGVAVVFGLWTLSIGFSVVLGALTSFVAIPLAVAGVLNAWLALKKAQGWETWRAAHEASNAPETASAAPETDDRAAAPPE